MGTIQGPWGREGVVALAHEPVGGHGVAARRTPAAVGDVQRHQVAEHVGLRVVRGDVLGGPADHRSQLDLPVDAVAPVGKHHLAAVADDRALARLQEEIGHAAILAPLPPGFGPLLLGAGLVDVAVEVDRRVEDLARVQDGREGVHVVEIVDVGRAVRAQHVVLDQVIHDLVEAPLEAVLVALDQLQHVPRGLDTGVVGIPLEGVVGGVDLDDELVAKNQRHGGGALDLEGCRP